MKITSDFIINEIRERIKNKEQIPPDWWCDASDKLNVLLGDETDLLAYYQQQVAQRKVAFIEQGKSVSEAKVRTEAEDIYREMNKQNAKIKQIEEFIRINKIRSRLKDNEYRLA